MALHYKKRRSNDSILSQGLNPKSVFWAIIGYVIKISFCRSVNIIISYLIHYTIAPPFPNYITLTPQYFPILINYHKLHQISTILNHTPSNTQNSPNIQTSLGGMHWDFYLSCSINKITMKACWVWVWIILDMGLVILLHIFRPSQLCFTKVISTGVEPGGSELGLYLAVGKPLEV